MIQKQKQKIAILALIPMALLVLVIAHAYFDHKSEKNKHQSSTHLHNDKNTKDPSSSQYLGNPDGASAQIDEQYSPIIAMIVLDRASENPLEHLETTEPYTLCKSDKKKHTLNSKNYLCSMITPFRSDQII